MSIKQNSVVTMHYTLKDEAGEVIERSPADHPLAYLHGRGNLIPGLERELEGKNAGDRLSVKVPGTEAFGERDERLVKRIPRDAIRGVSDVRAGMRLQAQSEQGTKTMTVTDVAENAVTVDANHPLAGKNLNFEVEITDVREATPEELSHSHAHGPGGHHD